MWLPQPSSGPIKTHEWCPSAARTQTLRQENVDYILILQWRDQINTILLPGGTFCQWDFGVNGGTWSHHSITGRTNMRYLPACLFTGPVLAKHEGINNSCPSPCRQITSYRWDQLTSARCLTARLLRHPSRWFDMLYSSSKLDCALDGQFPLLGQTGAVFTIAMPTDLLSLLWCWAIWSVTAIFIFTEVEWGSSENMMSMLVFSCIFCMQMSPSVNACRLSS